MPRSEQAAGSAVDATGGKSTRCTAPGGGTADAPERAIRSAGLRHALSGGVAGAFAKTCTAPLARLVILYQVQAFNPVPTPLAVPSPLRFATAAAAAPAAGPAGAAGAAWRPTAPAAAQPRLLQALLGVARAEGWRSLWRGNLVTILHRVPYSSINFYTYEATSCWLAHHAPTGSDVARRMASGAMAGLMACTAAYPLDLVRTRLAAQTGRGRGYYSGIGGTLRRIVTEEGASGLYRGLGATLVQVVPSLALSFTVYETARNAAAEWEHRRAHTHAGASGGVSAGEVGRRGGAGGAAPGHTAAGGGGGEWDLAQALVDGKEAASSSETINAAAASSSSSGNSSSSSSNSSSSSSGSLRSGQARPGVQPPPPVSTAASLACGCLSGLVTSTATFPLDVVRRRMQVHGAGGAGGGASYAGVIRQIWSARGASGFYAGIAAEYCKVVPGVAIAYGTYEAMKAWTKAD